MLRCVFSRTVYVNYKNYLQNVPFFASTFFHNIFQTLTVSKYFVLRHKLIRITTSSRTCEIVPELLKNRELRNHKLDYLIFVFKLPLFRCLSSIEKCWPSARLIKPFTN